MPHLFGTSDRSRGMSGAMMGQGVNTGPTRGFKLGTSRQRQQPQPNRMRGGMAVGKPSLYNPYTGTGARTDVPYNPTVSPGNQRYQVMSRPGSVGDRAIVPPSKQGMIGQETINQGMMNPMMQNNQMDFMGMPSFMQNPMMNMQQEQPMRQFSGVGMPNMQGQFPPGTNTGITGGMWRRYMGGGQQQAY